MLKRREFIKVAASAALLPLIPGSVSIARAENGDEIVRFAIAKPTGNLNPHKYSGLWGAQDLIFEPLVKYGHDGIMEPGLAESWELLEGGHHLRLHLRKGVRFHDGAPWNADALKWNLDRWIYMKNHNWMNHVRLFDGLHIIDSHTVEMDFKEAPLSLMYELSYTRPVRFLSPTSVKADGSYSEPIGTGPWKQVSSNNSESVFERFDDYWGEKPTFKRLELKVLPDSRSRMAAIRAGEIDVTGGDFFAPINATEAKTLKAAGIKVEVTSGISMLMGFNPDRMPALKDANVRKAISMGFDRSAISKVLYHGFATPAGSMFPPSVPLSGTQFPVDKRNVVQAKALLEKAGWTGEGVREKNGKSLVLELVVSEEQIAGSRSVAEVMQAQLKEIGVKISIRSVDHASRHSDIPKRKFDMAFFLTFGAPYEPFGTMAGYLLSTYDNGVDGKLVVDAENLDPLLIDAMSANEDTVATKLQMVFDWLHDQTAFAPIMFTPSFWAHTDRIKGFSIPATEYDTPYDGITISHTDKG